MYQSSTKLSAKIALNQAGMVTICILVMASLAAVGLIFYLTNSTQIRANKIKYTRQALVQAKDALIGYSVGRSNLSMPGAFPCPDTDNDGDADSCGASTSIGRLPWKTLGMSDLRDGDGECLWYVVSPIFLNTIHISARGTSQPALNSDTAGSITIYNDQAMALPSPAAMVIAAIIAPSSPLNSQSRVNLGSTVCGGNMTATNYLDVSMGINNATANRDGNNLSLIMGAGSSSFNDQLIYVAQEDLYKPLRKRVVKEMIGKTLPKAPYTQLYQYYIKKGEYPCPSATVDGAKDCNNYAGYVPYLDVDLVKYYEWLVNNKWFSLTSYVYSASDHVSLTVAGGASKSSCIADKTSMLCD